MVTTARVVTTDADQECLGRVDCRRLWLGYYQGRTHSRMLMVGGEQPVVRDALCRQWALTATPPSPAALPFPNLNHNAYSAGTNNSVIAVPTATPPIST